VIIFNHILLEIWITESLKTYYQRVIVKSRTLWHPRWYNVCFALGTTGTFILVKYTRANHANNLKSSLELIFTTFNQSRIEIPSWFTSGYRAVVLHTTLISPPLF